MKMTTKFFAVLSVVGLMVSSAAMACPGSRDKHAKCGPKCHHGDRHGGKSSCGSAEGASCGGSTEHAAATPANTTESHPDKVAAEPTH